MAKSDLSLVASLLLVLLVLPLSLAVAAGEPRKALAATPTTTTTDPKVETKGIIGGYNPITNIKDPRIQGLGKYAVDEHNKKAKTHLIFQEVFDGKYQVVQGTNYDLKLKAHNGGLSRTYGALVFSDLKDNRSLEDFYGISRN